MTTAQQKTPAPTPATRPVEQILEWAHSLVWPTLRKAIEGLPNNVVRIGGYHLGWLNRDGTDRPAHTASKGLRSALLMLTAHRQGADPEGVVPAAVAVELVHNFSLLHDDIVDDDRYRRSSPAAWTVFGAGPAIIAADVLAATAYTWLADSPAASEALSTELAHTVAALNIGQALDLAFEARDPWDISVAEYLEMVSGKTGSLLAF